MCYLRIYKVNNSNKKYSFLLDNTLKKQDEQKVNNIDKNTTRNTKCTKKIRKGWELNPRAHRAYR